MHGHRNIGPAAFPRQGAWLGRRVEVVFPNTEERSAGRFVRDDVDSPDMQIICLDDGRLLVKGEWIRFEILPSTPRSSAPAPIQDAAMEAAQP
jgi:hypothetical protein